MVACSIHPEPTQPPPRPYLISAMHRVPLLAERGIQSYFSGPESFTPDGTEVLGECPDLKNLFVCTGFNSHGITVGR